MFKELGSNSEEREEKTLPISEMERFVWISARKMAPVRCHLMKVAAKLHGKVRSTRSQRGA